MAVKSVALVGSTGSIGTQTLDEIRRHGDVNVVGLSCNANIERIEQQIREFKPRFAAVQDEEGARKLRERVRDTGTKVLVGEEGVLDACVRPNDIDLVVIASVGLDAFTTTVEAVKFGRDIAPASKEPFVFGSDVILPLVKRNNVKVHPIDSEHSAIWQCVLEHNAGKACSNGNGCIVGIDTSNVKTVWLGCSGGPFYGRTWDQLKGATAGEALNHPTWKMGGLITVNSATLYNKGQEKSEARALFELEPGQIDITIDRTSMIHAIVEFKDGTRLMNMSKPDMHDPIRFALFGERDRSHVIPANGVKIIGPDRSAFRLLRKAEEADAVGGTMPAVMVGANGAAVEAFLNRAEGVDFGTMVQLVEETMCMHIAFPATFKNIIDSYKWADSMIRDIIGRRYEPFADEDFAA